MKIKIHFLLMLIASPVVLSLDYCHLPTCDPFSHTLCILNINDLAWDICGEVIKFHLSLEERNRIVELHNYFREIVHKGQETRGRPGPQPAAANVTYLEWDNELAEEAQVWVQQCPDDVDECRNVEAFEVNQNIGHNETAEAVNDLNFEDILWDWYSEVERFNNTEVAYYSEQSSYVWGTENYSQMIWENTTKVGCAQMKYYDDGIYGLILVCNYGPRGNNIGKPVYTIKTDENKP